MSKAEQKAKEYEHGLDYYHYTSDNPSVAYKAGYDQAEKDLALTADDVSRIFNLVRNHAVRYTATEACYPEVAEIFNKERQ